MKKDDLTTGVPPGWHSRGYLPHFDGGQIAQFITFRLFDSLPQSVLEKWKQELSHQSVANIDMQLRRRIEAYLDMGYGSGYLKDPRIASMVQDSLLRFDGLRYYLAAWVIMPNHVHFLLTPIEGFELSAILHSVKSYTSHEANDLIGRAGRFWQTESFDRFIRNENHYMSAIAYIENNPVKARLCKNPQDWPYSSASFRENRA